MRVRGSHHSRRRPRSAAGAPWVGSLLGAALVLGGVGTGCRGATLAPVEDPAAVSDQGSDPLRAPAPSAPQPRLVVVLVVDQMRADYLTRFGHLFEHGLARLQRDGAWFQAAEIAHAVTMTSPGHATIATGTDPRRHGVIQNNWIDRSSGEPAYAVDDAETTIVGPPGVDTGALPGRSSAMMRRSTVGSWLKAASPPSKVVSIAYKDRASVLMAGTEADGAYWYEPELGAYVSSSVFGSELPTWVQDFDRSPSIGEAASSSWERTLAAEAYDFVGPDDVEAEGRPSVFPHRLREAGDSTMEAFYRLGASPMSDRMSFQLATESLSGEGLGLDEAPDLLMLSLSGADLVGHRFGPDSHEIVDYYVDLDRRLGEFLGALDRRFPGEYALILTADHGGTRMPEVAVSKGHESAQRILGEDYDRAIAGAVERARERLGLAEPLEVRDVAEGLWFDLGSGMSSGKGGEMIDAATIRGVLAEEIRALPFVVDAYTYDEVADPSGAEATRRPWLDRYGLSFVAERSADIQVRGPEGWLLNARATGTSHGTPYAGDSEVPLILFGAGIPAKMISSPVYTSDVAPTAAALLGVPTPEIDGRSLLPLLGAGVE